VPPTPPAGPLTRRRLTRGLVGGLAATAVAPALDAERAAAAPARRHAKVCRHWHRCKQHRNHTCRRMHRCKHRFHRAPRGGGGSTGPTGPTDTTPDEPTDGPTDPTEPGLPTGSDFATAPLPTPESHHLASRFSYGVTPALHEQMRAAGSPAAWFRSQLDPAAIADAETDAMQGWWTSIDLDHTGIWQRDRDEVEYGWQAMENYARWCLLRRISSRRQVLEVMTEFWEDHLHVPLHDDGVFTYRAAYGKLIRSHALGRFDEMLVDAITHPAMGISLDNAGSTKRAPNENLGRELLELHTVGRGAHTEDDVKASARILTGYRVDTWRTWNATYDPASHWTGAVSVVGFSHANADPDGRAVARAYLTHLAHHPRTAARIARKLALRFVSDEPSQALVDHLAGVYLAHDTAIKPVLLALVAHDAFRAAAGRKVRTPTDDVVATHRVLGTTIARPVTRDSCANAILWQTTSIGHSPFAWGRPDGPPQDNRSWSSASRLLASFQMHHNMAGGWWPRQDVTYRTAASWLPTSGMRFDALVDHLCTQLLGKHAPARLVQAACAATQTGAGEAVTANHPVMRWKLPMLLTTLLDTPDHLHR
jgi:uncharacterized protein (DUF1800 family)